MKTARLVLSVANYLFSLLLFCPMRHQISFPAALWATCTLSILPVFAQSSVQETPINPTASLTRAASGHLVIAGQPFQRALLLVGQCGTPPGGFGGRIEGQRVLPLGQTWIDCDGNGRAQILIQQASCPVFAQLWTPPGPNAATPAGSWSLLCVSFPSGGQINSTAKPGDLVVTEFMKDLPHPGKYRPRGHFGFAGHRDPVMFRNIAIKRLP